MFGAAFLPTRSSVAGLLAMGLVCLVWLGRAQAASDGSPRATVLVQTSDASTELAAARLLHALGRNLVKNPSLEYVDFDGCMRSDALAGGSSGETRRAEARKLFNDGRRAYDNLNLNQALSLLDRAVVALESSLDESIDWGLYENALIYQGATLVLMGDAERGAQSFRKLLVINRQANLDPLLFPPSLVATFESTASAVKALGRGTLDVRADPAGAEVWVDGVFAGIGPQKIGDLPQGAHSVRLVRHGHVPFGALVDVRADSERLVARTLEPLPGAGRLDSLLGRLQAGADRERYPEVVDELLEWAGASRLFYLRVVRQGETVVVRGFHFDGVARRRLVAIEKEFDPDDAADLARVDPFFTSLCTGRGGRAFEMAYIQDEQDEQDEPEGIWNRWWFWTAVGVVVVASTGLALGLTLGGESGPVAGDVFFRF